MGRSVLVVAALALAAGGTAPARTSDTLPVAAQVATSFTTIDCPAGSDASECAHEDGRGLLPGVGAVTSSGLLQLWFGPCSRWSYAASITAPKGAFEVTAETTACVAAGSTHATLAFTFTGGSGAYVGASGGGSLGISANVFLTGGKGRDAFSGSLTVPGLSFDVTPPEIAGATAKTVKVRSAVTKTRVRFAVTARDAVDGVVPAVCTPRSGSLFKLGRTTVTCSATDTSANTAKLRFVVTVRH